VLEEIPGLVHHEDLTEILVVSLMTIMTRAQCAFFGWYRLFDRCCCQTFVVVFADVF